jgi:hypothetical protein
MATCMARVATSTRVAVAIDVPKETARLRGPFACCGGAMDQLTLTALQAAATALVE